MVYIFLIDLVKANLVIFWKLKQTYDFDHVLENQPQYPRGPTPYLETFGDNDKQFCRKNFAYISSASEKLISWSCGRVSSERHLHAWSVKITF